jgi:hypothetical protein
MQGARRLGTVVAAVSLAPYEQIRKVALLASAVLAGLVLLAVALGTRWRGSCCSPSPSAPAGGAPARCGRGAQLSGGEQQRVAVAAAFARRPRLVLADEPTGELDSANEALVLRALARPRDETDATMLVVTHSPQLARAADRVVEMRDGRILR